VALGYLRLSASDPAVAQEPCANTANVPDTVLQVWREAVDLATAKRLQALPLDWSLVAEGGMRPWQVQTGLPADQAAAVLHELQFLLGQPVCLRAEAPVSVHQVEAVYELHPPLASAVSVIPEVVTEPTAHHWAQQLVHEASPLQALHEHSLYADSPLVRMVNSLIQEAHAQGASDIHIEPDAVSDTVRIRLRQDGRLRNYLELPGAWRQPLVARIKVMCDLDIAERRKPQDGKIRFERFGPVDLELRVVTMPTAQGQEDVVLRLLHSAQARRLDALDLSPAHTAALQQLIQKPHGMLLCVGPTGSGKTTTLHALLQQLNTPDRKIWTAEDPVEITQRGLRQMQVHPRIGLTFAEALRSLLRADPDVIMVGEIRDRETADMAVEASLTGHLVLSTLHTNSAAETLVRLNDLGLDAFALSDSLVGVIAQRLVRRICADCVQWQPMDSDTLQTLTQWMQQDMPPAHPWKDPQTLHAHWQLSYGPLQLAHASGCEACSGTGLRGRVALHELLVCNSPIKALIQQRASSTALRQAAAEQGASSLLQDGVVKVLQGLTTLAEVRAATLG
jgi:type II secretory ATPase GspE/PulE/Tfp pilus assembly ATPase PilB-like protein